MSDKSKRDVLRSKLLGGAPKRKSEAVTLFGEEVELRQPTLASILDAQDTDDVKKRTVDMIVKYAYVPGTDDLIFEPTDADVILEWPFGDDLVTLQKAVARLTGVNIASAEVELKRDPLEE